MMLEYILAAAVPGAVVAGAIWGRWQRKHRHIWTPWTRIWDEDKQVLTNDQERFCKECGFREDVEGNPEKCPPHRWGKWEEVSLKGGTVGQQHNCLDCGFGQLGKLGYPLS